jgi:hypothetical protein
MAGTATISSTFTIEFVPSNTAATVITNPGRSFRVIGVQVNNPTGGALNFTLTDGSANIINGGTYSAGANSSTWADLDTANVEISSSENLTATAATGITSVEILCVATGGGQSLPAA